MSEGKIEVEKSVGGRRHSWLKDLGQGLGRKSVEIFMDVISRDLYPNGSPILEGSRQSRKKKRKELTEKYSLHGLGAVL